MFYRLENVLPLEDYRLLIIFCDGARKVYDVKPLFGAGNGFEDLENVPGLFGQVKADPGGYGVSWNDGLDLSCNELWYNGRECGEVV